MKKRERNHRRSDAKIPPEMHERVAEWCAKPNDRDASGKPIPQTGGLAFARVQCAADGLNVSLDTLSRFYSWWELEQDLDISLEREEQVLAKTGDKRKAREAGEALLMRLGLAKQDPELMVAAAKIHDSRRALDLEEKSGQTKAAQKERSLAQKDQEIALAIEKFQFDGAKAVLAHLADLKAIARDRSLSEDDQIKRVQLRLWGAPPKEMEAKS